MNFEPFIVTFKLALFTTLILFIVVLPVAYFLSFSKWKGKIVLESVLMLPIVLPPTVLGFYFLTFLGGNSVIGSFLQNTFDVSLVFSFEGILLGSIIYCTPFMVTPLINGFRGLPKNMIESTYLLKKSRWNVLWYVYLPNIKKTIWSAVLLTFAHTIGEFGLVLMIGGSLPETKVASVAIYDEMNGLNYGAASNYAIVLLLVSFVLILSLNFITRKNNSQFA